MDSSMFNDFYKNVLWMFIIIFILGVLAGVGILWVMPHISFNIGWR